MTNSTIQALSTLDILCLIFENLKFREIKKCASVNKAWHEAANLVSNSISRKKSPDVFCTVDPELFYSYLCDTDSGNFDLPKEKYGLNDCEGGSSDENHYYHDPSDIFDPFHEDGLGKMADHWVVFSGWVESELAEKLKKLEMEPAFLITFFSAHTSQRFSEPSHYRLDSKQFEKFFPLNCQAISLAVDGCIVMDFSDFEKDKLKLEKREYMCESEKELICPSLSMMYFPRIPELKISTFRFGSLKKGEEKNVWQNLDIENPKEIKCIIAMSSFFHCSEFCNMLNEIIKKTRRTSPWTKDEEPLAFGGCFGDFARASDDGTDLEEMLKTVKKVNNRKWGFRAPNYDDSYESSSENSTGEEEKEDGEFCAKREKSGKQDTRNEEVERDPHHAVVGWIISGPDVNAASVVLDANKETREEITKKLSSLKKVKVEGRKSFAFMFAQSHGKKTDAHIETFREFFPQTPLIGAMGFCQMGWDSGSRDHGEIEKTEDFKLNRSNVIVLVAY